MEDLGAVSEPSVQTEKEDDKSKSPEEEFLQPPDSKPTDQPDDREPWKSGLCACCNNPCNGDTLRAPPFFSNSVVSF
ncbi:hypothetical protein Pint_16469 [Pistacia integerrima]|uniref:Uncharacterized protein n=1 Tax=Pistacia integerrima TaxID=434235 RepID=A0ACC0ZA24_9ROSI|nr:hypothetical protein Pint_16469 [Pistacia integerrima]